MDSLKKRLTDEFVRIVQIDSLSLHEEKMFEYLKNRLSKLPVEIEFLEYTFEATGQKSGNLLVKLPARTQGRKTVFFDAHVDTVEPGIGIKPIVEGNVIKSSGDTILGSDDKAGVAAMIIAIEELAASRIPYGDVYFLFTSAEEIGLTGVHHLDFSRIKADYGFVLDSHGKVGGVIVAAPFHYHYEIVVKGKASHAGIAPEQGISAIKTAARLVTALPQGKINRNTVSNIGIIEGGKATNIIPDECIIRGEYRSHDQKDIQSLKEKITDIVEKNKKYALDIQLTFQEMYRGFKFEKSDNIIRLVNRSLLDIGVKPRFERTGGGSNTNVYNQNGLKVLTLAVGMMNVHSSDEYVEIDDLENLTKLIVRISEIV